MQLGPIQLKWLESLEQHPERQGRGSLGKKNYDSVGYTACCLGELLLVAGMGRWKGNLLCDVNEEDTVAHDRYPHTNWEKLGLRNHIGDREDGAAKASLAYFNDEGKTWPEIAAIVRKNPEQYFTKSY